MKLLIATKNPGKFMEISEVLNLPELNLVSLRDLNIFDDVEETGLTHEENAKIKARYFFKKTGLPTLAEDSGINVNAFPDELGVQTRRWGGLEKASDEEWIKYFLKKMEGKKDRGAQFVCVAALILNKESYKNPFVFSGETKGTLTHELRAPLLPGIPISSCFLPEGYEKVYAALSVEEKNKVSHRGKAMHAVKDFLDQFAE